MKHPFLFEEGVWVAQGHYSHENGQVAWAQAESRITHHEGEWRMESRLSFETEDGGPQEIVNEYRVVPFTPNRDSTRWTARNGALGGLTGKFVIAGDTVLSVYGSENGRYTGTEVMVLTGLNEYKSRGCLLEDGRKLSSWWMDVRRVK